MKIRAFDVMGNIAIVKFPKEFKQKEKKKFADKILKDNSSIKTVLEKTGKFSGRLRKMQTKYVAGEKTKEVLYKENDCVFRFNIDKTYFSSRLSNERKEIASKIKKGDSVLVMFAGIAPFSIIIAKKSKPDKVYSNEINREANKYAKLNIELNKVKNRVILIPGDIRRVVDKIGSLRSQIDKNLINQKIDDLLLTNPNQSSHQRDKLKYSKIPKKFDIIVMPRPQLKETFLKQAFILSKKGTKIYYYDFCRQDEESKITEKIKDEAKKAKKKIKILKTKPAGEIAPYKIRLRVDMQVEN